MTKLNDYDELSASYQFTDTKPDKKYSTYPTVAKMLGDINDKTILDLGCGSGFFTFNFANSGAKKVIGIDNSSEQIRLAEEKKLPNTEFICGDIYKIDFPKADIINAPYVINYANVKEDLIKLFEKVYNSLPFGGKFSGVIDLPENLNIKKYGATKNISGEKVDGANIKIQLFNNEELICALNSKYYLPETIEQLLLLAGFKEVIWFKAIVSQEGLS